MKENFITLNNGYKIHYLSKGSGKPILMLHGWPTSSILYRHIIEPLSKYRRVIVPDLIGFGKSSKPLDVKYNSQLHKEVLNEFVNKLSLSNIDLVVHDLGGPLGMVWALDRIKNIDKLIILNTIILPEINLAIKLFLLLFRIPLLNKFLVSSSGISMFMKLGIQNKHKKNKETLDMYKKPFLTKESQKVLLKTILDPPVRNLIKIKAKISSIKNQVLILYGEKDFLLPFVEKEMQRIKSAIPHAQLKSIPDCGHFLQEDEPEILLDHLVPFLAN